MYNVRPNLVIGFHGCDKSVRDTLLESPNVIEKSEKPYDWLGHGIYFWENDYERALEWSDRKHARGEISEPAVVGAILHLGNCCDLLDRSFIKPLASFHTVMKLNSEALNKPLPENRNIKEDPHNDKLLRFLDCATIEFMHEKMYEEFQKDISLYGLSNKKIFDSTRGVFTEGGEAFPGAALLEKSHIQICVRNLNCILGFFLPRNETDFMDSLNVQYSKSKPKS